MADNNQTSMLPGLGDDSARAPGPEIGYIVTNHLNLMYMLGIGLIPPRIGFGDKYYRDTIGRASGWIPVFTRTPGLAAVEHSTVEARYLLPCILRINLKGFSGPVLAKSAKAEEPIVRALPAEVKKGELILLPGPLPTTCIDRICFRSPDERKKFLDEAGDYSNVAVAGFSVRTEPTLFKGTNEEQWPPMWMDSDIPFAPLVGIDALEWGQAFGGVVGMLRTMATRRVSAEEATTQRESLGVTCLRFVCDPSHASASELDASVLAGMAEWTQSANRAPQFKTRVSDLTRQNAWRGLFWRLVKQMLTARTEPDSNPVVAAVECLQAATESLDGNLGKRVKRLCDDLLSLRGLPRHTPSELFRLYTTPLPRAMILLHLRANGPELLDFDASALKEEDWLAAAVLFGVRSGWQGLPTELRGVPAVGQAVSHRMASFCHRMAATEFDLGNPPPRPKALVEPFLGDWEDRTMQAALDIARKRRWDCIRTRVKLGRGSYRLTVGPGGVEIEFRGEPKNIRPVVNQNDFLSHLARDAGDLSVETEVAKTMGR